MVGMIGFFVAMTFSVLYLAGGDFRYDSLAASVVEVSVMFATVNLVTGSIWARVIWGIWWTWDYRLTSQLVCVLIFAGYLMMRRAIDEPTQRARLSSALTIFGCVDVVIVWKSIEWFRNNHPGPVLSFRTGGNTMYPPYEHAFYINLSWRCSFLPPPSFSCAPARNRPLVKSILSAVPRTHKKGFSFMDVRNFTFMFYGFLAAWLIVLLYVVSLARRGARLRKELEDVKQLISSAPEHRS